MLNIKYFLKSGINSLKKITRTGDYWYWLDDASVDEIDIVSMVYPLRYDILIRKNFFSFYIKNRDLYLNDVDSFMRLAKEISYYVWFSNIIAVRSAERLNEDINRLNSAYEARVKKSIGVYESISSNGFDSRHPIVPHTGEIILHANSGRISASKYHMGDGCHRLACLIAMGYEVLPKKYFRVKVFNKYTPLDNTSILSKYIDIKNEWLNDVIDLKGIDLKEIKDD